MKIQVRTCDGLLAPYRRYRVTPGCPCRSPGGTTMAPGYLTNVCRAKLVTHGVICGFGDTT
jgi:hypothetical protein